MVSYPIPIGWGPPIQRGRTHELWEGWCRHVSYHCPERAPWTNDNKRKTNKSTSEKGWLGEVIEQAGDLLKMLQ